MNSLVDSPPAPPVTLPMELVCPAGSLPALKAAVAQAHALVGPYLVEVGSGEIEPRERLRETIRAGGPTVGHSLDWKAA